MTLRFGIYAGGLGADQYGNVTPGPPENSERIAEALDALHGDHPFVVRGYTLYSDARGGHQQAPPRPWQYATPRRELDLVVCFHEPGEDLTGWLEFLRRQIREHGPVLASLQIAEEANHSGPGGDGGYPAVRRAIIEGVRAARAEADRLGLDLRIGCNSSVILDPAQEFWTDLGRRGGSEFTAALDYVGLDLFPDVFRPIPPERLEAAITGVLTGFRHESLAAAGIPATTPIHITENGWATGPNRSHERQAEVLETVVRLVDKLSGDLNITTYEHFSLRDSYSDQGDMNLEFGLFLIDPASMRVLATTPLPGRGAGEFLKPGAFTSFGGGAYFYLDNRDRAVVGANNGHVLVYSETAGADGFTLDHDYDLSGSLRPGETLNSVLPDSTGRLWFVTKTDGVVGALGPETGAAQVIRLGNGADGEIENSFAVGVDGDVYIATNREMLRFDAGPGGSPDITWRVTYSNSGEHKPGQVDDGTGTTPTVLPGGYVAITDNADPMNVVVYRTARDSAQREVCTVPVFAKGAGNTENSLIGAGNSLIVENNYGYSGPDATLGGKTTTPGFARIDIDPDGNGCHQVWANNVVAAPTVVAKLSLATGLVYTYAKGADVTDPWYWTALDFRTGNLVWQRKSGSGPLYNNNYAGIAIGPDGAAYLGVLGGLISLRDN